MPSVKVSSGEYILNIFISQICKRKTISPSIFGEEKLKKISMLKISHFTTKIMWKSKIWTKHYADSYCNIVVHCFFPFIALEIFLCVYYVCMWSAAWIPIPCGVSICTRCLDNARKQKLNNITTMIRIATLKETDELWYNVAGLTQKMRIIFLSECYLLSLLFSFFLSPQTTAFHMFVLFCFVWCLLLFLLPRLLMWGFSFITKGWHCKTCKSNAIIWK